MSKIVQSGGFICLNYLIAPIKGLTSLPQFINNKLKNVLKNKDKSSDKIKTVESSIIGIKKPFRAGITLANNEIKDIIKVIKSLENRGILQKGTSRKTNEKCAFNEKCIYSIS